MNRKIKAMLVEKGISQTEIAAELGVNRSAVSGALNGHWESAPVREAVARRLNISMDRLNKLWKKVA